METEAVTKALIAWLNSQDISPQDGVSAIAIVIGRVLGERAWNVPDLLEGLNLVVQLIQAQALETLNKRGKFTM